ncbi:MAG: hypothetical protein ABIR81_04850 [Ginsengibacter sp.]
MKYTVIVCTCILVTINACAQKFTSSLNLQLAVPQGEYKEANRESGLGARLNFLYRPSPVVPIKIGIEAGMQVKGSTSQYFAGYVFGFYEEYKLTASNNIASLNFVTRLQPLKPNKVKPFVDAIAGWNIFFSTVSTESLSYYNSADQSYSKSSKAKWAFNYGAAAGLDIPLNRRDELGMELKVAYVFGSNSDYYTNPRINDSGEVFFTRQNSLTNMLIPQAGLRWNFR